MICPVEIHVDGSSNFGALKNGSARNLLDLDDCQTDDENLLGDGFILIGDSLSSDNDTPEKKILYPDANSHSNYNLLTEDTQSFDSWSKNHGESYAAANSHKESNYQDSNSHSKYDFNSDNNSDFKNVNISYERLSPRSTIANSHETYGILTSDSSDNKTPGADCTENHSRENLIPCDNSSYEIANSHSNYQIFYNSQTQHDKVCHDFGKGDERNSNTLVSPTRSDSSRSSRSTEETSTTCDIEECLVQIEESLLNIEQNLLHVQDLDIPELKNLLYKSPSIERSLFEVQDLLCTENLESVKMGKLFSYNNYEDDNNEDNDEENLIDMNVSSKDLSPNSDENLLQFNDDNKIADADRRDGDFHSIFYKSEDKNVNFIPNSLGRTPTKGHFKGASENIKAYSIDNGAFFKTSPTVAASDLINDNLDNKMSEKKLLESKKCHSRTNSLDENSMFHNTDGEDEVGPAVFTPQRKTSLESLRNLDVKREENNFLGKKNNGKAKSDDTLDNKSCYDDVNNKIKSNSSRRSRKKLKENRLAEVEAKTDEFRRKIESIISSRQSIVPKVENCTETMRRNSQENKSPRIKKGSFDKEQMSPNNAKQLKSNSFDKRKRKKTSRMQSAENAALVPSKLISLSLSLLLAALLQAVRCLTDLVEDAFRSVSYDRNGLLE